MYVFIASFLMLMFIFFHPVVWSVGGMEELRRNRASQDRQDRVSLPRMMLDFSYHRHDVISYTEYVRSAVASSLRLMRGSIFVTRPDS
jgi:hypothetical protein